MENNNEVNYYMKCTTQLHYIVVSNTNVGKRKYVESNTNIQSTFGLWRSKMQSDISTPKRAL